MKKMFLLATAALLVTGVTFANDGGRKKKCGKGKKCASHSKRCCKKSATAAM
ncbi:hypothetical protein LK994_05970 [Ferruginibacter lapsinanis]|uniref:hypothetical protein n=1 Tax=Ferruginibacter lapsinanis TaxID=563172 RepID=UPI001E379354|nr:hypothetical protein [Ferruginibacter lapsinanis]UEG51020.1 hypothetical protein LK994_05970 [Ferruginibacter lapsinanis]